MTRPELLSQKDLFEDGASDESSYLFDPFKFAKKGLKQFFGGDETQALVAVMQLLNKNPGMTKDEAFRLLSQGKGMGKSHHNKDNGELKAGISSAKYSSRRNRPKL